MTEQLHSMEVRGNSGWSILEGYFDPENSFNTEEQQLVIDQAKRGKEVWNKKDPHIGDRIFYSELTLSALELVNPEIFTDRQTRIRIGRDVIGSTELCLNLQDRDRTDTLKGLTDESIDPGEVPVMQVFMLMQENGHINHDQRTMLDAITRTLHIRQNSLRQSNDGV